MAAFRGPKVWLWRWRRNPLRRRSDALEAWIMLTAWAFTVLGGAVTGLAASQAVEHGLALDRARWHGVPARLTEDAPDLSETESGAGVVWAKVRWTAPDGTRRSGRVRVYAGTPAGTPVTVWTDPEGRLVTRPTTAAEARVRSSWSASWWVWARRASPSRLGGSSAAAWNSCAWSSGTRSGNGSGPCGGA